MSGVNIRVSADSTQARSDLRKLENSVGKIQSATASLATAIKASIATYSGFVSTKAIIKVADQFKGFQNRLRLVQKDGESLSITMGKLNKLSIDSRTSLSSTIDNYSRLARSLKDTNMSQGQFLRVTEAINKATKLGGQPLATQQAALFQLSQAFSSGVLRGEEFNSVSEGAPEILTALTDSLKVGKKELREMAFAGELTADVLTSSLLKALPRIQAEFELLLPTVEDLTKIMQGEFRRALNEINNALGISERFGNKVKFLTGVFSAVADNAEHYFARAKATFLKFYITVGETIIDLKKLFLSLFSIDFDITSFKTSVSTIKTSVTDLLSAGSGKASEFMQKLMGGKTLFDVGDNLITGIAEATTKISNFALSIIAIFANIFKEVIQFSSYSGTFWKGVDRIGGPKLTGGLQEAFGKISNFADLVKGIFESIFKGSVVSYDRFGREVRDGQGLQRGLDSLSAWGSKISDIFTDTFSGALVTYDEFGRRTERTGGIFSMFERLSESVTGFVDKLSSAVTESEAFRASTSFFSTLSENIKSMVANLDFKIDPTTGLLGYMNQLVDTSTSFIDSLKLKELANTLTTDFLGTYNANPAEVGVRTGGFLGANGGFEKTMDFSKWAGQAGLDFGAAFYNWLKDNKLAALGAGLGIFAFSKLDEDLKSGLLQGAALGIGYVIAAGFLTFLTSGFGIVITALIFGPKVLQAMADSGLTEAIGRTISEGIVSFFVAEEGSSSTLGRIVKAIVDTASSLGTGLLKGAGLDDTFIGGILGDDASGKLAGALALVAIGLGTRGILKNGFIGAGVKLAGLLFSPFGRTSALALTLGTVFEELYTNPKTAGLTGKITKSAKNLGKIFRGGLQAAIVGAGVNVGSDLLFSGGEGGLTDLEDQVGNVLGSAASGASLGATIGTMIAPGIGTAIGAALGGAGGAIVGLFKNPLVWEAIDTKLRELFLIGGTLLTEAAKWVGNLGVSIGSAIIDAFKGVTGFLKDWWKGIFGGVDTDETSMMADRFKGQDGRRITGYDTTTGSPIYGYASGGYISGSGGPKDDKIPAMLSNKEYVIKAASVAKFGKGFMDKINAGIMPSMFGDGTGPDPQFLRLQSRRDDWTADYKLYEAEVNSWDRGKGSPKMLAAKQELMSVAQRQLGRIRQGLDQFDADGVRKADADQSLIQVGIGTGISDEETLGQAYGKSVKAQFKSGLVKAISEGDLAGFGEGLLDSFAATVIDSLASGITENLFSTLLGADGNEGPFAKLFSGIFNWGDNLGKTTVTKIEDGITTTTTSGGLLQGLGGKFKSLFSSIFGSDGLLGSAMSGIQSLLSSGKSGLGSILSFGKTLFANQGGIVPSTPYSQAGKDSVPAMLTPGEMIVPANRVGSMGNTYKQAVVNLSITGDISRQTRQEIVRMLPTIANGVNTSNRENGIKS